MKKFKFLSLLIIFLIILSNVSFAKKILPEKKLDYTEFYNSVDRDENGYIVYRYEVKPELARIMDIYYSTGSAMVAEPSGTYNYQAVVEKELNFKQLVEQYASQWKFIFNEDTCKIESFNAYTDVAPNSIGTPIIFGFYIDPQKEALDSSLKPIYEEVILRMSKKAQNIRTEYNKEYTKEIIRRNKEHD